MSYTTSCASLLVPGGQKSGQNRLPCSLKEASSHSPAQPTARCSKDESHRPRMPGRFAVVCITASSLQGCGPRAATCLTTAQQVDHEVDDVEAQPVLAGVPCNPTLLLPLGFRRGRLSASSSSALANELAAKLHTLKANARCLAAALLQAAGVCRGTVSAQHEASCSMHAGLAGVACSVPSWKSCA